MWRDGPVVGELVVVGAAKDDGLVGRLAGHRAHARAPHHRPERMGRAARPCRRARARPPRRRSRPSRSRSRPLPGVRVPRGPRGSIPEGTLATSWVLANYGRLTPGAPPAVDKIVRKAPSPLRARAGGRGRAAQRRQGPGHRLRRPAGRGAAHAAGHHRPRLPLDGQRRRHPRRRRERQLPLRQARGALHHQRPPRRRVEDRHRPEVFHCLQIQLAGRADGLQTLDADRAVAGRGQRVLRRAACSPRTARRPTARPTRPTSSEPLTPLGQPHLRRRRLLRPLEHDAAPARSAACGEAIASPSLAGSLPGVAARAPPDCSTRGRRASTAPRARRRVGRQRAVRAAAVRAPPTRRRSSSAAAECGHAHCARVRRAPLRALRRPLDGRARSGCTASAATCASARRGLDAQPTSDAVYCLGAAAARPTRPSRSPAAWRREGHDRPPSTRRPRAAPAAARHAAARSSACRSAALVDALPRARTAGSPPVARTATRSRPRTPSQGRRRASGTCPVVVPGRCRQPPGLHGQHQLRPRRRPSSSRSTRRRRLPDGHLPDGLVPGRRARRVDRQMTGLPAGVPGSRRARPTDDRAGRLRWLVGVARRGRSRPDAVSGVYFAQLVGTDNGGESHVFFVVRNDALALGHLLPDVRHDLAGLQPATAATASTRRPAAGRTPLAPTRSATTGPSPRAASPGPGLDLQRRVPDDPLAGAQRLRRQLRDRRRHRPLRLADQATTASSCPPVTTSTGQASSAPTSRRRATRASTWPSSAATRCSGRRAGRTTTARSSVTRRRTTRGARRRRPDRCVDRVLARPGRGRRAERREARERAHRPDLHGQRAAPRASRSRANTTTSLLAPHVGRERERHGVAGYGHAGLRVGLRQGERACPPRRARRPSHSRSG